MLKVVSNKLYQKLHRRDWSHGVVLITSAQLYSTKPEIRFCTDSNLAHNMLKIRDGMDLWQWFLLEIKINVFL